LACRHFALPSPADAIVGKVNTAQAAAAARNFFIDASNARTGVR
jgi:hypothetical protein